MKNTLQVVPAFDLALITEIPIDDAPALEAQLEIAALARSNRDIWLKPHERMAILKRAAQLLASEQERFTRMIAQDGGKPWTDAAIDVTRAIDELNNAAE